MEGRRLEKMGRGVYNSRSNVVQAQRTYEKTKKWRGGMTR
jgi:hypothetical protein